MYIKYQTHAIHLNDGCKCVSLDDPDMLAWEAAGGVYTTQEQMDAHNNGRKFLSETDWKVIRHRDQIDLGVATSLSDAEYQTLLQQRQDARNAVLDI